MSALEIFSPAKLNLFLAVTGRRADGFHELVSVVAPVMWGDTLTVVVRVENRRPRAGRREVGGKGRSPREEFSLECDDPAVPRDGTNLVLRAAELFRAATGWDRGARFVLTKRIPMGAGLGGGSSNGAMALRALNRLAGELLAPAALADLAGRLGSDCALFLHSGPVVMRGRGERVEPLPESGAARLRGRRVLIFKPSFGVATPWAYGRLAESAPGSYLPAPEAEARLVAWLADGDAVAEKLLFNNMESVAFAKFIALPALLERLHERFGVTARMSGSGSACFALLNADSPVAEITAAIREAWGASALVVGAQLQ